MVLMFFHKDIPYKEIQNWITIQLPSVYQASKNGIDIEIKPHKQQRSNEQNKFLMAILCQLVKFHNETGFMPQGCDRWMMRTDILKEYYKARYGVEHTHKLSTAEFTKFIDFIQQSLVEESQGEWEILTTDSMYLKSLLEFT